MVALATCIRVPASTPFPDELAEITHSRMLLVGTTTVMPFETADTPKHGKANKFDAHRHL